jgi:hypothetical protein
MRSASRTDLLIQGLWIALASVAVSGSIVDTDPFWMIRAGLDTLDGRALVGPDRWSWAPVPGDVVPNSPGWNVLLAAAWSIGGSWGLFVAAATTTAAGLSLVAWFAARLGAGLLPRVAVIVGLSILIRTFLTPRAGWAATVLLLAAIALALRGRSWFVTSRAAPAALAVLGISVAALGGWIHLSWGTMWLSVAAAWAAIWWLPRTSRPDPLWRRRLVLTMTGSAGLATGYLLGPYGWSAYQRAGVVLDASAGVIEEWTSPFASTFGLRWWPLAVGAVLVILVAAAWSVSAGRRDARAGATLALSLAAVPFALSGLLYARFVPIALTLAAPLAAGLIQTSARLLARRFPGEWATARPWRVVLAATGLLLVPLAGVAAAPHARPAHAEVVSALPEGCRLFSPPLIAAEVLLMRPDVPVWIDGRTDYWGRERIELARRVLFTASEPGLVPAGATCVLLPDPGADAATAQLVGRLDASPDWRRATEDGRVILWVPR